jgi:decaprenylphospho-beta-D-erythro-pentofuranosid-2-ulose 2-reductase
LTPVENALGDVQGIALFGASSEIGQAIVRRLVGRPDVRCVLAARDLASVDAFDAELTSRGAKVERITFDALDIDSHSAVVSETAAALGDIDVAIIAVGVLGHGQGLDTDPADAARQFGANATGCIALGLALAQAMRAQGHGRIVVLSSVAGERVRKSNFVYGAAKAGLDGFAQGLDAALVGTGVSVLVVRPGFVRSRMTEGLDPAPLSTTPDAVAEVVVKGLAGRRRVVWAPGMLRWLFVVLRHLPTVVFRRLPF